MKTKYVNSPTIQTGGLTSNSSLVGRDEVQKASELDQIVGDMSASLSSMRIFVSQIQDRLSKLSYIGLEGSDGKGSPTPEPITTTEKLRSLALTQTFLSQELEGIVNFLHRTV